MLVYVHREEAARFHGTRQNFSRASGFISPMQPSSTASVVRSSTPQGAEIAEANSRQRSQNLDARGLRIGRMFALCLISWGASA
jgi:hypothetical protein